MTPDDAARKLLQGHADAGQVSYADALRILTSQLEEIDRLRGIIAKAPHDEWCLAVMVGPSRSCDCWQASA